MYLKIFIKFYFISLIFFLNFKKRDLETNLFGNLKYF